MNDIFTFMESGRVHLASADLRRLSFSVVSTGCAVYLSGESASDLQLVYAGEGQAVVRLTCEASALWVELSEGGSAVIEVPELRTDIVGWTDEDSLTDLSPRPYGAISPEIKAVMDQMNRNAIIREQAMLRALGQH